MPPPRPRATATKRRDRALLSPVGERLRVAGEDACRPLALGLIVEAGMLEDDPRLDLLVADGVLGEHAAAVLAVVPERAGRLDAGPAMLDDCDPEVPILVADLGVVAADLAPRAAAEHRDDVEEVAVQLHARVPLRRHVAGCHRRRTSGGRRRRWRRPAWRRARRRSAPGSRGAGGHRRRDTPRTRRGGGDADVARLAGRAGVRLGDEADRRVGVGVDQRLGDISRIVGAAVVDDDQLDVAQSLGEDALDGLGEVAAVVEAGDDDRHAHRLSGAVAHVPLIGPDRVILTSKARDDLEKHDQ